MRKEIAGVWALLSNQAFETIAFLVDEIRGAPSNKFKGLWKNGCAATTIRSHGRRYPSRGLFEKNPKSLVPQKDPVWVLTCAFSIMVRPESASMPANSLTSLGAPLAVTAEACIAFPPWNYKLPERSFRLPSSIFRWAFLGIFHPDRFPNETGGP